MGLQKPLAGQAVALLGIRGEMWYHGSPHPYLGQQWLLPSWGSPLSKITTPKPASSSERHVWESQPPQCPHCGSPTATQRTAGRDGAHPPPGQGCMALVAPCSLVAHGPALVSGRASPRGVRSRWPSRLIATGSPGCPYV